MSGFTGKAHGNIFFSRRFKRWRWRPLMALGDRVIRQNWFYITFYYIWFLYNLLYTDHQLNQVVSMWRSMRSWESNVTRIFSQIVPITKLHCDMLRIKSFWCSVWRLRSDIFRPAAYKKHGWLLSLSYITVSRCLFIKLSRVSSPLRSDFSICSPIVLFPNTFFPLDASQFNSHFVELSLCLCTALLSWAPLHSRISVCLDGNKNM